MEPITGRTGTSGIGAARQPVYRSSKTGPSDFEAWKGGGEKPASSASPQPPVTTFDDPQKVLLAIDHRRKLDSASSQQKAFNSEMRQLGSSISDLDSRVTSIGESSAAAPLRRKLESIEADFQETARILKNPASLADPERLLQMQADVYKLAHDIEIMSRTLSEVTSGVKAIVNVQL